MRRYQNTRTNQMENSVSKRDGIQNTALWTVCLMPCTAFTLKEWGRDPRAHVGDPVPSSANLHTEEILKAGGQSS